MKMLKNIANLIKVKTIVTMVVIAVFAALALRGDLTPENVMIVVSTVIAFYFGTQHEAKVAEKRTEQKSDKGQGDV